MSDPVREFHEKFWSEVPPKELTSVYVKDIPVNKILGATRSYAPISVGVEPPLLLIDNTVFGSAKTGLLLTGHALYYRLTMPGAWVKKATKCITLDRLRDAAVRKTDVSAEVVVNGERVGTSLLSARERVLLNSYFRHLLSKELELRAGSVEALIYPERVSSLIKSINDVVANDRDFLINLDEATSPGETFRFAKFGLAFTTHRIIGKDKCASLKAFRKVSWTRISHPTPPLRNHQALALILKAGAAVYDRAKDEYSVKADFGRVDFHLGCVTGELGAQAFESEFRKVLKEARGQTPQ